MVTWDVGNVDSRIIGNLSSELRIVSTIRVTGIVSSSVRREEIEDQLVLHLRIHRMDLSLGVTNVDRLREALREWRILTPLLRLICMLPRQRRMPESDQS